MLNGRPSSVPRPSGYPGWSLFEEYYDRLMALVRLFVETFWLDRVKPGQRYRVRDSETLRDLGEGEVIEVPP